MPTYCYETADGVLVEKFFPIGKAPRFVRVGKKLARRSFAAERKGVPSPRCWPMECFASGVNASQAGELRAYLANHGVPTEVTPDGDPVYRSAAHRRKALKVRGLFDKSAFIVAILAAGLLTGCATSATPAGAPVAVSEPWWVPNARAFVEARIQ